MKGEPFTAGTRFLEGFVPDQDSEALARLRRAGCASRRAREACGENLSAQPRFNSGAFRAVLEFLSDAGAHLWFRRPP